MKNLQVFYSVQQSSGRPSHVFTTYEDALHQCQLWRQAMNLEFQKWQKGDTSADVMVESVLEPDGEGGCYQSHSIHPACLPSGIYEYDIGSVKFDHWKDNPGSNSIKWGNPAIARPVK